MHGVACVFVKEHHTLVRVNELWIHAASVLLCTHPVGERHYKHTYGSRSHYVYVCKYGRSDQVLCVTTLRNVIDISHVLCCGRIILYFATFPYQHLKLCVQSGDEALLCPLPLPRIDLLPRRPSYYNRSETSY